MALLKANYINQFGVTVQYWKITNINLNSYYKWCDIEVRGYCTQEDRDNGNEPVERLKVRAKWTDAEYGTYFSPEVLADKSIFISAYEYIKTKDFFVDCVDIL